MNFYKHHLGDYDGATAHLSWEEDMAYTRLLRAYYRREQPIPAADVYRLVRATSRAQRKAVDTVLAEFFTRVGDVWHNKRADEEIASYQAQAETNRRIAKGRAGKRTVNESLHEPHNEPLHEPLTKRTPNHKPEPRTRSQNQSSAVPSAKASGTDGEPSKADPAKDEIWRTGRGLLEAEGKTREAAGSFLGKLVKDYGQKLVLDAVRDCHATGPASPSAWLVARCQERRQPANRQEALERRNAEAVRRFLDEETPIASH